MTLAELIRFGLAGSQKGATTIAGAEIPRVSVAADGVRSLRVTRILLDTRIYRCAFPGHGWCIECRRDVHRPTSALRVVVVLGLGPTDVVGDEFLERVQPLVELFGGHGLLGFAGPDNPRRRFQGGLPG
jgi:hypothetical protein